MLGIRILCDFWDIALKEFRGILYRLCLILLLLGSYLIIVLHNLDFSAHIMYLIVDGRPLY